MVVFASIRGGPVEAYLEREDPLSSAAIRPARVRHRLTTLLSPLPRVRYPPFRHYPCVSYARQVSGAP